MNPERYERLQELFLSARNLETGERGPFLTTACGSDLDLLGEVQALLASDAAPRHSFEPLALGDASQEEAADLRAFARGALAEVEAGTERE